MMYLRSISHPGSAASICWARSYQSMKMVKIPTMFSNAPIVPRVMPAFLFFSIFFLSLEVSKDYHTTSLFY